MAETAFMVQKKMEALKREQERTNVTQQDKDSVSAGPTQMVDRREAEEAGTEVVHQVEVGEQEELEVQATCTTNQRHQTIQVDASWTARSTCQIR